MEGAEPGIVICGDRIEAKNPDKQHEGDGPLGSPGGALFANYAGGADGVLLRSMLRKAAAKRWHCATVDVRTAFLLAPRRRSSVYVVDYEASEGTSRSRHSWSKRMVGGAECHVWAYIKPFQLD